MQPVTVTEHPSQIILAQLGGNKFIAMTGAKDFVSGDNPHPMLRFRVPKRLTKQNGTHFQVTLMPCDTYKLELMRFYNGVPKILAIETGIYCDMLQGRFTAMTGLDVRL